MSDTPNPAEHSPTGGDDGQAQPTGGHFPPRLSGSSDPVVPGEPTNAAAPASPAPGTPADAPQPPHTAPPVPPAFEHPAATGYTMPQPGYAAPPSDGVQQPLPGAAPQPYAPGVQQQFAPGAQPQYAGTPQAASGYAPSAPVTSESALLLADEMRSFGSPLGLKALGLMAAAVFGFALIMALVVGMTLMLSAQGLPFGSAVKLDGANAVVGIFALVAAFLGGGFGGSLSGGFINASFGVAFISLSLFAAIAYSVWRIARKSQLQSVPRAWWTMLVRSALEGLIIALVSMTIALIFRPLGFGGFGAGAFFYPFLVVLIAGFLGRWSAVPGGQARAGFQRALREIVWYFGAFLAFMLVLALILVIVWAVQGKSPALILLWIPFGLNIAALAFGTGQLGMITAGPSGAHLWDVVGLWSLPIILLTFAVMALLTVVIGVRRGRTGRFMANRVWQLPVGVTLIWLFAALTVLTVSVPASLGGGSAFGSMTMTIAPGWDTLLLVPAFAIIVSLLAEVAPGFVYSLSPQLLPRLAGTRAANAWLAGAPVPPASAFGDGPAGFGGPGNGAAAFGPGSAPVQAPGYGSPVPLDGQAVPQQPIGVPAPPVPGSDGSGANPANQGAPLPPPFPAPGAGQPQVPTQQVPPAPNGAAPFAAGSFAGAQQSAALPPVERRPMSKRAKRTVIGLVTGIGVAAVLVVGGLITVSVLNGMRDPAAEVRAYMSALQAGDADQANKLVAPGVNEKQAKLLSNAAFAGKSKGLEIVAIETKSRGEGAALVEAKYRVQGENHTARFTVKQGEPEFLVLDTWKLESTPLLGRVSLHGDRPAKIKVGEVEIETNGEPVYAYPGVYEVSASSDSKFFEVETDDTLTVAGAGQNEMLGYETHATPALEEAVLTKVKAFADACVKVPTNMESGCPYAVRDTDLAAMKLVKAPDAFDRFDLPGGDDASARFSTNVGVVSVTANASAFDKTPKARERDFTLSGSYTIEGDEITLEFSAW